jgi:hypothetical protein
MRLGMRFLILALFSSLHSLAYAQAALTVGAVQSALIESLASLRSALNEATYDAKSVGNSYQANAQNVLKDINLILGSKLAYTFDRLNEQERALTNSAERLISLTKEATEELTKKNFERARVLMIEGDIVAYNTSYSLPCRTTRPRIMLVDPLTINADDEAPVIKARGNFLLQGKDLTVSVGKEKAEITQRTDTEIAFIIPRSLMQTAASKQISASATISGLSTINRKIRFVLGCSEKSEKPDSTPSIGILINPPVSYRVAGTLVTTHLIEKIIPDLEGRFDRTGNNHCDDSFSVDQNYCLIGGGSFHHIDLWNQTANCNSSVGPINASGDRCVFVGGHVGGCGANRGPFNTWAGCKGRGWAGYNYKLWRKETVREEASRADIKKEGIPGESVFSFVFPGATSSPEYKFSLVVEKLRGERILERKTLSDAGPTSGVWRALVKDGTVSVTVQ